MTTICEFKTIGLLKSFGCKITNLYYDINEKQFFVNSNSEEYRDNLTKLSWHGRRTPITLGRSLGIKTVPTESNKIHNISFKTKDNTTPTIILARRYSPHNAGHLLCETAIPIEYLSQYFGIRNISNKIIIFDDGCWDGHETGFLKENSIYWFEGDTKERREQAVLHSNNILTSLGDKVIFNFAKYIGDYIEKINIDTNEIRYLKIDNTVLFGIGNISPWVNFDWKHETISSTLDTYVKKSIY